MRILRNILLYFARTVGAFRVAQFLTRNRLRILCYHGFSVSDEYQVLPHMFMRASTFERRLRILQRRRIPVIRLDEAVQRLKAERISSSETVITIDDGWSSTLRIGVPLLERYGFPACVYATTEHLGGASEVFNLVLHYMIHRSPHKSLVLTGLHADIDGVYDLRRDRQHTAVSLILAFEKAIPVHADRQRLLPTIASAMGMNLPEVLRDERFSLLTREQMRDLAARGFDIELHSHRHRLPDQDFESVAAEIERNREELEPILGKTPTHFCFPSGQYSSQHVNWLTRLKIESATTCDPGLNGPGSCLMLLKRALDSDCVSDITFEAEVSGFRELARTLRLRIMRGHANAVQSQPGHPTL